MQLARVVGSVVATAKTSGLDGRTLLVVVPVAVSDQPDSDGYVAVDRVGAGTGELVLVTRGSAARRAAGADVEIDAVVVAIVDRVDVPGLDLERPR
jgi:ethanolamine utilization protein EutN